MTEGASIPDDETGFDHILAFTIPDMHARGRAVRLGPLLDEILSAHAYPPAIRNLLAEALVICALIGSLLKDGTDGEQGSQMTMQVQTQGGIVDLLVCDYRAGEIRGYVRHDAERLAMHGANPSLYALFGQGYLGVTFDLATTGQRYQGIVPLEGDTLSECCQRYFVQSEQVPTLLRVGVRCEGERCVAGGLLVQHLAEGEEGRTRLHVRIDHPEWDHVAALAGSTRHDELVDPHLSLQALVWRLFHEEREVRVEAGGQLTRGCRCSAEYYQQVLGKFSHDDLAEMRGDDGLISVDCAFCSKKFDVGL